MSVEFGSQGYLVPGDKMSMKPKAALVKAGILPAGSENKRGRLSEALKQECAKLVAEKGWDIEGLSVSRPASKPSNSASADTAPTVTVERVARSTSEIADLVPQTRDERDWQAFTGTVEVGMRTCCNFCRNSLTHCPCPEPRVWADYNREATVTFKPRTKPLPIRLY